MCVRTVWTLMQSSSATSRERLPSASNSSTSSWRRVKMRLLLGAALVRTGWLACSRDGNSGDVGLGEQAIDGLVRASSPVHRRHQVDQVVVSGLGPQDGDDGNGDTDHLPGSSDDREFEALRRLADADHLVVRGVVR